MASSTQSGSVVVTPMYRQESGPTAPAFGTTPHVSSALGNFLKGDPKALGTVQIMIGVLNIVLSIAMIISGQMIGFFALLFCCGGLIYISSGALSVAANNKLNKCLVRGALGMNIISTITAGIAVICFSLIIESLLYDMHPSSSMLQGVIGVLLVFSILEFIISICVSAFACRAVCGCSTEMTISPILDQTAMGSMQTEKPHIYDELLPGKRSVYLSFNPTRPSRQ